MRLTTNRSWSLWGFEKTLSCESDETVSHVQFVQNQGLLIAAVSSGKVYIWDINQGMLIGHPVALATGQ